MDMVMGRGWEGYYRIVQKKGGMKHLPMNTTHSYEKISYTDGYLPGSSSNTMLPPIFNDGPPPTSKKTDDKINGDQFIILILHHSHPAVRYLLQY